MYTIVFDLDGTLIDTAPDLIHTLNLILTQEGLPALPYAAARNLIGGGAQVMIQRALTAEGKDATEAKIERLYAAFIAYYSEHIADRSRLFPGLGRALDEIGAAGFKLAVCTNKLEWLSLRLLKALDLTQRFAAICGPDTFGVQKPDPEVLRQTVRRAGGEPDRAIMVGDSKTDIDTARAARVPVIAVDFGYTDVPIVSLQPDRIISAFSELPAAISALLGL
ncbi:MAG: phosphoglycolate phosphatase [Xanthobacteraceae bacterium]